MAAAYRQDMPPPGGFQMIRYKRNLPTRGLGAMAILALVTAVSGYGLWRVGGAITERRELRREKAWSRIHLVPLLLAEGDRDAHRREQASTAREREIMKNVPGWEAGKRAYSRERRTGAEVQVVVL